MDYGRFCSEVLKLNPKIRFAAVCDMTGKILCQTRRRGTNGLLSREATKLSLSQGIVRWSTRKSLEREIGKAKYAMAEYEKIKRISMAIDDNHVLFISTDVKGDHNEIIDSIGDLIAKLK
jgi:hypothetical protein